MGGSQSKRRRPSYEDGKVRDPKLAERIEKDAPDTKSVQGTMQRLLRRAVTRKAP